ncbi:MAG: CPBP family intramembrane glutamic endopeptidase [Candidatus Odinarchaeota archaeon]
MDQKNNQNEYWHWSVHTKLSWWFGVMATGIQFFLGFRHLDSLFGQLCIVEGFFGLSGILLLDIIHGQGSIYPKKFKKIHPDFLIRFVITFGIIAVIQFIFQIIPLITSTEMALAIVFCPVCEEFFFRGLLMEPFFKYAKKVPKREKIKVWKNREITFYEIFGIMISGAIFSLFHINYYGNPNLIFMVMFGGSWLALAYWYWKDLTLVILAHFLLNIIFVVQFYQVYGL